MKLPPARATFTIAAATALAWAAAASGGLTARLADVAGFVPARVTMHPAMTGALSAIVTPLSATLVHASLLHVGFNLLMLVFCGRFVEAAIGPGGLVLLYIVGAYGAAAGQTALDPGSLAPMIGASGAISAVVGAYALLFGQRRAPKGWGPRSGLVLHVVWLAAAWAGLQSLVGLAGGAVPGTPPGSVIAIGAHIGGFIAGLICARPLLLFHYRHA